MMKKKIFFIFDEVDNKTVSYFESPSFGHVVRNNWRFFQRINSYFDQDWSAYEIGSVREDGFPVFVEPSKYVKVDWSEYLSPEIQAERLSSSEQGKLRSQPSGVTGNPPPEVR